MNFSKEERAMWLEDWRRSGKKAWTYAKENGLIPQTFVSWTKREHNSGFVELPTQAISPYMTTTELRIEKGDIILYVPLTASMNELRTLLNVLGAVQ